MICFDIPLFMVVAFLLLTLVVGIYFSKKEPTFREYAVGSKQFATATLVATVLATAFGGGGLVRTIERVHNTGLYWIIISFSSNFAVWMVAPLALRMGPFMRHLSLPETIGKVYGKYARIITALSSIGASIALIAGQINVMSLAVRICID